MDPDKVSILKNAWLPQTPAALLSFISTVGFYKNFLGEKIVQLAKRLREMIQSGNINWTPKSKQTFQMIKDMITDEQFLIW